MVKLPTFTFICGHAGSGKSTLAQLLSDQDPGLVPISFAEPLYDTMAATFYPGTMDTAKFKEPPIKAAMIPFSPKCTHRQFLIEYGNFLKSLTNKRIFGDLAKRRWEDCCDAFPRAVFDDARLIDDVAPFIESYGSSECLIVLVERPGVNATPGDIGADLPVAKMVGIRRVSINNNSIPEKMLDKLLDLLNPVSLDDL